MRDMVSEKGQGQEERMWNCNVQCHVGNHGSRVEGQPPWGECNQEQQFPETKKVPAKRKGAKSSGVQDGW